jgi:hypothetical protein
MLIKVRFTFLRRLLADEEWWGIGKLRETWKVLLKA